MANGDDPCQSILDAIDGINQRIQDLEAQLVDAPGPERTILHGLILQAQQRLRDEEKALQRCRANPPPPRPAIVGVEVTQAIQYFRATGQGSDAAPDNSVPLVTNKPTVLRVYVEGQYSQLSGEIGYGGPQYDEHTLRSTVLSVPGSPPGILGPADRGNAPGTLNFVLPAVHAVGRVEFRITVYPVVAGSPADRRYWTIAWSEAVFTDMPPLRIHGVLVHYQGLDYFDRQVDVQPSIAEFEASFDLLRRTYPISQLVFTGYTVLPWSAKTAVDKNFADLYAKIGSLRTLSGTSDVYVGMLSLAAGFGGTTGLGANRSALTQAGVQHSVAHETGHALDRLHAPCGNPAGPDSNYPAYHPYPPGSIGEYGFDVLSQIVYDPEYSHDFMSYCEQDEWISPYTYTGLMNTIRGAGDAARTGSALAPRVRVPCLTVMLRLHRDGKVEILQALQVEYYIEETFGGKRSGVILECLAAAGALVTSQCCVLENVCHRCQTAFDDVSVVLPWLKESRSVRIVASGEVLADLPIAEEPPEVRITGMEPLREGEYGLKWSGKASASPDPALTYGVRYSHDGAVTWRALAVGLTTRKHIVDLAAIPGGEDCRLQVLASAGFRTSVAESEPFDRSATRAV